MIDHYNKVIFIHIPRCAGTYLEKAFTGFDYWDLSPILKHAPASIYKNLFPKYWETYFKFSVVRNPYSRFRSLWKYKNEYRLELDSEGKIDIKKYIEYFGTENIVELQSNLKNSGLDVKYTDKSRFRPLQIYGNYLNENIDRIYHYESLPDMLEELGERFKINFPEQIEE